jgi:hypothetical protein
VVARLEHDQVVVADDVDQSVFIGDAPGPRVGQTVLQRFGLSDAVEGIAGGVVDQPVDALDQGAVDSLPVGVVLPPGERERSSLAVELVLGTLAAVDGLQGIQQAPGIRRRSEQIGRLLPGGVVGRRHEHSIS